MLRQIANHKKIDISPPQWMIIGFALIILIGTALLATPLASANGRSIGFLNAIFTATSAVCVTGLTVVDTASTFSMFGEIVLLVLIQLGGLGFMTFGVIVAILLGKRLGLRERMLIQESTKSAHVQGLVRLSLNIFLIAVLFEAVGSLVLTLRLMPDYGLGLAAYYGVFHSISAFNNAGFILWPDNMIRFAGDPVMKLTITVLFLSGGLGFTVLVDLYRKRRWRTLSLNSKISLMASGGLVAAGFLIVFGLELLNPVAYQSMTWWERSWVAFFQAVTPRSSGFNSIDLSLLMTATQFFLIFLMFIGASSGSTGGGIKVTTFIVLIVAMYSSIRGREQVHIFERRIPYDIVLRALSVIIISLGAVMFVAFLLTITEPEKDFIALLFEATSAFCTVGLSLNTTMDLSPAGKAIITATMFLGRLGPLTLAFALAQRRKETKIGYAEEKILIG
ncbi:TrkH family potassium uptake protein [Paenibacillus sp.]|uniref:TrkH family potassium uptake protein n=1 Tax=Paenibacillus sp. TaxID=58172 RepID=UPI002D59E2EF|nr:TrkH family potassium uptake protein [Paenibacillus sp.]HZG83538.1 TrkH family potassium uptake protein [Paenibacillus sp.]